MDIQAERKALAAKQAVAIENVLQHFTESGQLNFRAYMEGRGLLEFSLCKRWRILGVTVTETELSFMAESQGTCMKFTVPSKKIFKEALEWFEMMAGKICPKQNVIPLVAAMPPEIVINVGVTDSQVSLLKTATAA